MYVSCLFLFCLFKKKIVCTLATILHELLVKKYSSFFKYQTWMCILKFILFIIFTAFVSQYLLSNVILFYFV